MGDRERKWRLEPLRSFLVHRSKLRLSWLKGDLNSDWSENTHRAFPWAWGLLTPQWLQGKLSEFRAGMLFYCAHSKTTSYDPQLRNCGARSQLGFTNKVTSPPRSKIDRSLSFVGRKSEVLTIIPWLFFIMELRFGQNFSEKKSALNHGSYVIFDCCLRFWEVHQLW